MLVEGRWGEEAAEEITFVSTLTFRGPDVCTQQEEGDTLWLPLHVLLSPPGSNSPPE